MEESKVLIWTGLKERMLRKPLGGSFGWISGVTSQGSVALLSCIRSTADPQREEQGKASKAILRQLTPDLGPHASLR